MLRIVESAAGGGKNIFTASRARQNENHHRKEIYPDFQSAKFLIRMIPLRTISCAFFSPTQCLLFFKYMLENSAVLGLLKGGGGGRGQK